MKNKKFDLYQHQYEYLYNFYTVIENLIPPEICNKIISKVDQAIKNKQVQLVNHSGLGNLAVSDKGGDYYHHIFKGNDIRMYVPELECIYHAILPIISIITCTDAVVSPYLLSDINIKAYPAHFPTKYMIFMMLPKSIFNSKITMLKW